MRRHFSSSTKGNPGAHGAVSLYDVGHVDSASLYFYGYKTHECGYP